MSLHLSDTIIIMYFSTGIPVRHQFPRRVRSY